MGARESQPSAKVENDFPIDGFFPDPMRNRRSGLRILCLHGLGSNSDITSLQIDFLQLRQRHGVVCDYLDADYVVPASSPNLELFSERQFFGWFDVSQRIVQGVGSMNNSLERIMRVVAKYGPYDGEHVVVIEH